MSAQCFDYNDDLLRLDSRYYDDPELSIKNVVAMLNTFIND